MLYFEFTGSHANKQKRRRTHAPGHLYLLFFDGILPFEPVNIPALSALEVAQVPHSVREKDLAPLNMFFIVVAFDTSHELRLRLKASAVLNMP